MSASLLSVTNAGNSCLFVCDTIADRSDPVDQGLVHTRDIEVQLTLFLMDLLTIFDIQSNIEHGRMTKPDQSHGAIMSSVQEDQYGCGEF